MEFEPSHEEVMLSDSVAAFGANHYSPSSRLEVLAAGPKAVAARWLEMAELGWLSLGLSEDGAWSPTNDAYMVALARGMGEQLMLEPFVTYAVLAPALIAGSAGVAASLLPGIADGRMAISLALGEPNAGFRLDHVETTAARSGDGFRLSGVKTHAIDGAEAQWFVVPLRTSSAATDIAGISLFLVHRDAPGLTVECYRAIDHHRHARLRLDDVVVERAALIGELDAAFPRLQTAVERAVVAHLAEALGSMEAVTAMTLDYLKTRVQFGKPIGSFQALQHRIVDMKTACEEARSMVYLATASLTAEPAERAAVIAAAKAKVGQCGLFTARQAVQLHGGLGFSAELLVSHHLKRQMMLDLAYGNVAFHLQRFAELTRKAA